ncbi:MAG: hypothetical protein ABIW38_01205 [Ferruginibacter sp.]
MIKGFLLTIAGLFIMVTVISLFIPSKINTVKAEVIHAPQEKIYAEFSDLQHWKNWQPVFKEDAGNIKISEPSSGIGAIAEWKKNEKINRVKITGTGKTFIRFLLTQEGEKDIENLVSISPVEDNTALQVQWQSITHLHWYPWEKFAGIFIEKMAGPGYEASLKALKKFVENSPN